MQLPSNSQIECRSVSPTETEIRIPASGRWGHWFIFAVLIDTISLILLPSLFVNTEASGRDLWVVRIFIGVLVVTGLIFTYIACRTGFASHGLRLTTFSVQLERKLFGKRTRFEIPTEFVTGVSKVKFYEENYRPVHGIEIQGTTGNIRFGSALLEEEKDWICEEVQAFLRRVRAGG